MRLSILGREVILLMWACVITKDLAKWWQRTRGREGIMGDHVGRMQKGGVSKAVLRKKILPWKPFREVSLPMPPALTSALGF